MNYRKLLLPLVSFSLLPLFSCSDPALQDSGTSTKLSVNGITQDGYVSGGIVWHDINNNRNLDSGEPYAITDEEGYFSKSRVKSDGSYTDYCASDASAEDQRYCLKVSAPSGVSSTAIIRLQKGIDIVSGEPFNGSISMKVSIDAQGNISNVVATPITAMLVNMSDDQIKEFASREGLTVSDLYSDFQDFVFTGADASSEQVKLIKAALQVHKSVELANALLKQRYSIIGDANVPSDASDFVYKAITDAFIASGKKLSVFMENASAAEMAAIFEKAETLLQQALSDAGKTAGTDSGFPAGNTEGSLWVDLSNRITETVTDIATAIPDDGSVTINKTEIFARAKAVEIIKEAVKKKIEKDVVFDSSGNATTAAKTAIKGAVGSSPIAAQKNARDLVKAANIATLKTNYKNIDIAQAVKSFDSANTVTIDSVVGSTGSAFRPDTAKLFNNSSLVNKEVTLTFGVTNYTPHTLDTAGDDYGKVKVFFRKFDGDTKPDAEVTTGPIVACNMYNDGKQDTSVYETEGVYIGGSWRKLDDFSVQLNATISGQPKTIVIKSIKFDTASNLRTYSADFNGDVAEYTPPAGQDIVDTTLTALPTDSAGCKDLLSQ